MEMIINDTIIEQISHFQGYGIAYDNCYDVVTKLLKWIQSVVSDKRPY